MIDSITYEKGLSLLEQLKYTINYDNQSIQSIIIMDLCNKLIDSDYIDDDQRVQLNKILKNVKK